MDRPLVTRALLGLASVLFVSGCAMGAIGLCPAIQKPAMSRLGILLSIASTPPWVTATSWRAQHNIDGKLADEHMVGYQMCLEQLAEDPDFLRQVIARIPQQVNRHSQTPKRGR